MKNVDTVRIENKEELIGFLRFIGSECRFVTLDTETEVVNMPKTGNPYWGTVKVCRRNGFVNADFVTAVEKRLSNLIGRKTHYTRGPVWYKHVMTEEGKPLCLCEHKTDRNRKYMQFYPIRNLECYYVHPTLGKLNRAQIQDMKGRMWADNKPEWKPTVITLAIDSIRTVTFRKIRILNLTVTRLVGTLARWRRTYRFPRA